MLRQSNFFLKTDARSPPRPVVQGELNKSQSGGTSSVKGLRYPT